jgi:hypothetical protein
VVRALLGRLRWPAAALRDTRSSGGHYQRRASATCTRSC